MHVLRYGQLAADSELSVKNGAELLDRLVKDIVSESASTYVSILEIPEAVSSPKSGKASIESTSVDLPTAFSLAKFIPLLQERIHVINPFTRTFLVSWVTLLDTIPDLELVFYLPAFLGGLFTFLSDPNRDVHVATQGTLERFLNEIKKIARIKRGIAESRKGQSDEKERHSNSSDSASVRTDRSESEERGRPADGDWVPGQDVIVDHSKILEILVTFLDSSWGMFSESTLVAGRSDLHSRGGDTAYCFKMDRQLLRDLSGGYTSLRTSLAVSSSACDG